MEPKRPKHHLNPSPKRPKNATKPQAENSRNVDGQKAVTQPAEHMRKSAEKTETPAGSRPKTAEKRCETAGTKKAETLPTEPSKDKKRPQ